MMTRSALVKLRPRETNKQNWGGPVQHNGSGPVRSSLGKEVCQLHAFGVTCRKVTIGHPLEALSVCVCVF